MSVIIYLEGNIGAGKSTIIKRLKFRHEDDQSLMLTEPVSEWPSLKLFYGDKSKYALRLQTEVMQSFHERETLCPDRPLYIFERSLRSSYEIFAKLNCTIDEMASLQHKYRQMGRRCLYPFTRVLHVYIRTSVENCINRIRERNMITTEITPTTNDDTIIEVDIEYLRKLEKLHDDIFLESADNKTIFVVDGNQDVNKLTAQILAIVEKIKLKYITMI